MRLVSAMLNTPLDFNQSSVWTLVVENPIFSRKIILALQDLAEKDGEKFLCYNDGKMPSLRESVEVIQSFLPFDLNTRELQTAIIKYLERNCLSPQNYLSMQNLLQKIQDFLSRMSLDLPCDVILEKLTASTLIKSAGPEILPDDGTLLGQLLQYMKLVRNLVKDRIFVFVQLLALLSAEEQKMFLREISLNHFHVLFLETHTFNLPKETSVLLIDHALCEIRGED